MTLADIGNTPIRMKVLESVYPSHRAIPAKAKRLEEKGLVVRIKKGMYTVAPQMSGVRINEFLVANHLHGPSYVSMQTALRYYGLIPEQVIEVISLTAKAAKTYTNKVGRFRYIHTSEEYYKIGVTCLTDDGSAFLMASPEKALCDLMIYTPKLNLRYLSELRRYLEEDLRIDVEDLRTFDLEILRECALTGKKKTMINQLVKLLENERRV